VDKYFGEFSGVSVDGTILSSGTQYTATAGSTNITLASDYLNSLSAGTHTLVAYFDGGVSVSKPFSIASAPSTPTNPTNPSTGGGGGGSSVSKDNCPNGDYSASYYDGTCGTATNEQGTTT
jgi:hypothetical protein